MISLQVQINIHDKNIRPFFFKSNFEYFITEEDPTSSLGAIEARDLVGGSNVKCNCTFNLDDTTGMS